MAAPRRSSVPPDRRVKIDLIQGHSPYAAVSSVDLEERHAQSPPVDPDHLQRWRVALPFRRFDGDLPRIFLYAAYARAGTTHHDPASHLARQCHAHGISREDRRIPGVQEVTVSQWFGGVYKDPKNMFGRMATEPERFASMFPEYKLTPEERKAFVSDRTACIIGKDTATKYNLKHGDRMTLVGDIFPVTLEFTVRGIFDNPADNDSMYFNIQYLFESLKIGRRDFAGTLRGAD
jgi:hypothetical protein